ncbi:barstar family protein [Streptomyces orinoci]|uniref:Barstar family protein n=1 Tax=Streptomyces orinoci TaxID=67339 RepID=A0ABV3JWP3_STRON|nr:barstar family protein [Streptomyces orinoci]
MTGQLPDAGITGLLDGTVPPGIYRLPVTESAARTLTLAAEAGWRAARLRLDGVGDKAAFLDKCAADLGFPGWFGHNWDALADCLMDFSWWRKDGEPSGYLLLAEDWDTFRKSAPEDARMAETIFRDAIDFWAGRETPLAVLLV